MYLYNDHESFFVSFRGQSLTGLAPGHKSCMSRPNLSVLIYGTRLHALLF